MELLLSTLKTSSKRIAEKTGKRHDHVLRDIRKMLDELDSPNLDDSSYQIIKDDRNYDSEILLNERLSLCLASGYSVSLRMAIIDDWAELKAQNNTGYSLPKTHSEALRALAQSIEESEAMQRQLEAQKPAVDFYQSVTGSSDIMAIGDVAKLLNMRLGQNKLFALLRKHKVIKNDNIPYQQYIDRGYFRTVESRYTKPDGSVHINLKTVVFQKGVDFIKKIIEKNL